MPQKVYMKEGVGFEGISMMQEMKSNTPKMVAIIVGFLVIGSIGIGVGFFLRSENDPPIPVNVMATLPTREIQRESEDPILTAVPTITQIPTSTPEVTSTPGKKLSPSPTMKSVTPTTSQTSSVTLNVAVLNGSGTKGAARGMSTVLTEAGYTVTRTGNADTFTYKGITLNIKNSKKNAVDPLKKTLSANGYLITTTTLTLSENEQVDAEIIVGSE